HPCAMGRPSRAVWKQPTGPCGSRGAESWSPEKSAHPHPPTRSSQDGSLFPPPPWRGGGTEGLSPPLRLGRGEGGGVRDARLLLRDEELVDLLIFQFVLATVGIDDEGGAARRHPHQVIAQAVHVLDLRPLLQDAEVGVRLRLDDDGLGLGREA